MRRLSPYVEQSVIINLTGRATAKKKLAKRWKGFGFLNKTRKDVALPLFSRAAFKCLFLLRNIQSTKRTEWGLGPLLRVLPVDKVKNKNGMCPCVCALNKSLNNGEAYLIVAVAQQCR